MTIILPHCLEDRESLPCGDDMRANTPLRVVNMLAAIRPGPPCSGKKRPMIDLW